MGFFYEKFHISMDTFVTNESESLDWSTYEIIIYYLYDMQFCYVDVRENGTTI